MYKYDIIYNNCKKIKKIKTYLGEKQREITTIQQWQKNLVADLGSGCPLVIEIEIEVRQCEFNTWDQ